jgi:hypothetical protein
MKVELTDAFITSPDRVPPVGKRVEYADSVVPGLALRVSDLGHRSFVLVKRFPLAPMNPTRRTICQYGEMPLDQVRAEAQRWLGLLRIGIDPKVDLARQRAEAQREQAKLTLEPEPEPEPPMPLPAPQPPNTTGVMWTCVKCGLVASWSSMNRIAKRQFRTGVKAAVCTTCEGKKVARAREKGKERWASDPAHRAKRTEERRERRQRLRLDPEVAERERIRNKELSNRPERKAYMKAYTARPYVKARRSALNRMRFQEMKRYKALYELSVLTNNQSGD